MVRMLLLGLASCPGFSPRAPAPRLSLSVGEELGRGNYGVVHAATLEGKLVVAKRAGDDKLAESYLDVEAAVNAELNSQPAGGFCTYRISESSRQHLVVGPLLVTYAGCFGVRRRLSEIFPSDHHLITYL